MGIYSRFRTLRLNRSTRSVLAVFLATTTLLGVGGQIAPCNESCHDEHVGHAAHADHTGQSANHSRCDAWSTVTAEHDRHDSARFEPASRTHHHDHGHCGFCLHAAVDLPARAHVLASTTPSVRADSAQFETPAGPLLLSRRSRAPPHA
ncbi:MAG: hypothetical protein AAGE94_15260 [Acidobacteriota bacterium]